MAKFSLKPDPTFTATVQIPRPGAGDAPVVFTFRHRTKSGLAAWLKEDKTEKKDADVVMEMATAWDLEAPFTKENIEELLENYFGSTGAIIETYIEELTKAKAKN